MAKAKIIERNFHSWFEFVTCAADQSLARWSARKSQEKERPNGWRGTETFQQAADMALRTGWPEGRRLIAEAFAAAIPKQETYNSITYDVAGAVPLVPLFIADDPACMMDLGNQVIAAKPVVKIEYNISVNASISQQSIITRGAAVLGLAVSLEDRGFSTELSITDDSASRDQEYYMSAVYKRAGDPLDLDAAAFAILNPSTMRRFSFAIMEQEPALEASFSYNYGRAIGRRQDQDFTTIFIPGAISRETPGSARLAVEEAAKAYLIDSERNMA
jgi:hypothetical protein